MGSRECLTKPATRVSCESGTFGNFVVIKLGMSCQKGSLFGGDSATARPMHVLADSFCSVSIISSCCDLTKGLLVDGSFFGDTLSFS